MRIAIGGFMHESHSFAPRPTRYPDFVQPGGFPPLSYGDKLFETVSPRMGDRNGGYLRILHAGWQKGDGADLAVIELLGSEQVIAEKQQKRAEARAKRAEETRKAMEEAEAQAAAAGETPPAGEAEAEGEK